MLVELEPEGNPNWETLSEVLKEVHKDSQGSSETVLILVETLGTCRQLKQVIKVSILMTHLSARSGIFELVSKYYIRLQQVEGMKHITMKFEE